MSTGLSVQALEDDSTAKPVALKPLQALGKSIDFSKHTIAELSLSSSLFTMEKTSSVLETLVCMDMLNVGTAVIKDGDKVVGLFTERDVIKKVVGKDMDLDKEEVSLFMTGSPTFVSLTDSLKTAIQFFDEKGIKYIVVLNQKGEPHSMLSLTDIVHFINGTLKS